MATLVVAGIAAAGWFGAAGAVSTAVVTAAAYVGAAYLDSLWISEVFPPAPVEGPRLGSIKAGTYEDGDPIQEPYGQVCRVPGHVLDKSEHIERKNTTVANGKGTGAGGTFIEYTYSQHVLVSFGKGPVEDIKRLRANGRYVWSQEPDVSITSSLISGDVTVVYDYSLPTYPFNGATWNSSTNRLTYTFPSNHPMAGGVDIAAYFIRVFDPGSTGIPIDNYFAFAIGTKTVNPNGSVTYSTTLAPLSTGSPFTGGTTGTLGSCLIGRYYEDPVNGSPYIQSATEYLTLTSTDPNVDLTDIEIGGAKLQIVLPTANAGSFTVTDTGYDLNGDSYVKVKRSSGYFTGFASGTPVELVQNNPAFNSSILSKAPEFHRGPVSGLLGAYDAPRDTLFESLRSPRPVPCYRGLIAVTLEGLQLADFGNTTPNFEADIVQSSTAQVRNFVASQLKAAGLAENEFDVSNLTDDLLGYAVRGPQDVRQRLAPIFYAYEIVTTEDDGVLRVSKRDSVEEVEVEEEDLGAKEDGIQSALPVTFNDGPDTPADSVVVIYRNQDKDFTIGLAQHSRRAESPKSIQRLDLSSIQLLATQANRLAFRTVHLAKVNRRQVEFSLPITYTNRVREGVRVTFPYRGREREVLVLSVTRAANGVLDVIGVVEQSSLFSVEPPNQNSYTDFAALQTGGVRANGGNSPVFSAFLNLPPLQDDHVNTPGVYFAACSESRGVRFRGVQLFQSVDESQEEWSVVKRTATAATIGVCATALPDHQPDLWDETSTLTVVMKSGELESVSELACLNGRNRALIGNELVGFKRATLTGTDTYELSGFLRGLRTTGYATDSHAEGELFVLLSAPGVEFLPMERASIGLLKSFKALSPGSVLAQEPVQLVACEGQTVTPPAPIGLEATRDASNNLTLSWVPVSRANVQLLTAQAFSLCEPFERYEVEILDPTTFEVLRTLSVSAPFANYTAAQQTEDGFTPGDSVPVCVYQVGDVVYRGFSATFFA